MAAPFTDTVTLFQMRAGAYVRTIVSGVQWSEKIEKTLQTGRLTIAKSITVTFPESVLDQIDLSSFTEEDCIFLGYINVSPSAAGFDIAELIATQRGGIIRAVNDNANRDLLRNIKVVIY